MAKRKRPASLVLEGLARIVGLEEGADDFEVLRTVAETLGLQVAPDGATTAPDDDVEEEEESEDQEEEAEEAAEEGGEQARAAKRARHGRQATAASSDEDDDAEEEDEEEEEAEEEEGDGGEEVEEQDEGALLLQVDPVKVTDERTEDEVPDQEAISDGRELMQWLVAPLELPTFEAAIWEQEPLLVRRPGLRDYHRGLFSKADIDALLRGRGLQYQFNIDVVRYRSADELQAEEAAARAKAKGKGKAAAEGGGGAATPAKEREAFNYNKQPPAAGREPEVADPDTVWRRFGEGCSLRVLHPQRWHDPLWRLLARLETYLQCPVGCNTYLTPAGTQGFAPHWDDVDVFIMQTEGRKRWRLYAPAAPEHVLPRYPSRDMDPAELGPCVFDEVLEPGDLLYLPRGLVHQGVSLPDSHSLHVTLSAFQGRSWAAFLSRALPDALERAARRHAALRQSLPRGFLEFMGVMHEEDEEQGIDDPRRAAFTEQASHLLEAVLAQVNLDSAADAFGAVFLADRLPPVLSPAAAANGASGGDGGASGSSGKGRLSKRSAVRVAGPGLARLSIDEGEAAGAEPVALVHHCLANRRERHAAKPGTPAAAVEEARPAANVLEFPISCAETLDALLRAGSGDEGAPGSVQLGEVAEPEEESGLTALDVAQALLDAGVLVRA